jgi:hypothetical protein
VAPSIDEPDDEPLRHLLAVEKRLQDLVRTAEADAVRRITAARAAKEDRLAASREAAQRADADRARAEAVVHQEALRTIDTAHQTAIATITGLSSARVDELARWALVQAIGSRGKPE